MDTDVSETRCVKTGSFVKLSWNVEYGATILIKKLEKWILKVYE